MRDLVTEVLAERRRGSGSRGLALGLAAATLLHLLALAALVYRPGGDRPAPRQFAPIRIVPLQALGGRPASRPAPPRPEPKPREQPRPPEPPPAKPAKTLPAPARPAPQALPQPEPEGTAAQAGSAAGNAAGNSAFGAAQIEGLDPDFKYDYYVDRMLALIFAQWQRPTTDGEVRTVVRFVVQKNGTITDLEIEEESGFSSFDIAALRAVRNASPLPRLPVSYRKDALTVTLIVR
ncbi:MAG TPA: energy transducer TonB [Thermoanaerobaculia bacterium]|nr:energy transducer TonB [Thermoanaerobaculia bacterium]